MNLPIEGIVFAAVFILFDCYMALTLPEIKCDLLAGVAKMLQLQVVSYESSSVGAKVQLQHFATYKLFSPFPTSFSRNLGSATSVQQTEKIFLFFLSLLLYNNVMATWRMFHTRKLHCIFGTAVN